MKHEDYNSIDIKYKKNKIKNQKTPKKGEKKMRSLLESLLGRRVNLQNGLDVDKSTLTILEASDPEAYAVMRNVLSLSKYMYQG